MYGRFIQDMEIVAKPGRRAEDLAPEVIERRVSQISRKLAPLHSYVPISPWRVIGHTWTAEQKAEFAKDWNAGASVKSLCLKFNVVPYSVYHQRKHLKLTPRPAGNNGNGSKSK